MTKGRSEDGMRKWAPTGFGGRLRELREAAGLTQLQLAWKAGVKANAIYRLEAGTVEPAWPLVCLLALALGTTPDAFLTGQVSLPERPHDGPPFRRVGRPPVRKEGEE